MPYPAFDPRLRWQVDVRPVFGDRPVPIEWPRISLGRHLVKFGAFDDGPGMPVMVGA